MPTDLIKIMKKSYQKKTNKTTNGQISLEE